jgi:hydroxymethylpyrimidine/phosphomethylpyrimidine kinase
MTFEEEILMYGKMFVALDQIENCKDFLYLIPEVRSNLVYAKPKATSPEEVLAVDGRITVVVGMPHAAGRSRFGASSHMARLIIEVMKRDPAYRAGVNFASDSRLAKWLEGYAAEKGWTYSVIDRRKEPDEIKEMEGSSMPWKVSEAIEAAGGRIPKLFYETGAVGKEPVTVLIGIDPMEVVREVCEIARSYNASP